MQSRCSIVRRSTQFSSVGLYSEGCDRRLKMVAANRTCYLLFTGELDWWTGAHPVIVRRASESWRPLLMDRFRSIDALT